jgi:hypothetical protein
MVQVKTATSADALELALHMRAQDKAEVWASDRQTPSEALRVAMQSSEVCRSLTIGGEVAAMWGVVASFAGARIVWLLTADVVNRHPLAFWRVFRDEVPRLLEKYPVLCNMVDARYRQAVRALASAGFTVHDPVPYGPDDLPFHFCIIRRDQDAHRNGEGAQARGSQAREERKAEEAKGRYLERGARPLRVRHHAQDRMEAPT